MPFKCSPLLTVLPLSWDTLLFIIVALYTNLHSICWVCSCAEPAPETWSFCIFLVAACILFAQYCWWPAKAGSLPCWPMFILYKVWIAMFLTNFVEKGIWPFVHNITEVILYCIFDIFSGIFELCGLSGPAEKMQSWKNDEVTELALIIIAIYFLTGFSGLLSLCRMVKTLRQTCNQPRYHPSNCQCVDDSGNPSNQSEEDDDETSRFRKLVLEDTRGVKINRRRVKGKKREQSERRTRTRKNQNSASVLYSSDEGVV